VARVAIPGDSNCLLAPSQRRALEDFYAALRSHDLDLLDGVLTANWEDLPPAPGQVPGPDGLKPVFQMLLQAFPDLSLEILEVIAETDRAAVRVLVRGTQRGPLFGVPPSGRAVQFALHEFHEFEGARLRRTWHMEDLFGLFTQIGAWPPLRS
jgi:steroid delta-isomerase-like uncharacterized protein